MDDTTAQMKSLLQAMEGGPHVAEPKTTADGTQAMKVLLEAVDAPEVDEPKDAYANTPNEQTLDSSTQQDMGRDLNKKKGFQSQYHKGDNPLAGRMQEVKLKEDALAAQFKKLKLRETADYRWSKKRELAAHLDDILRSTPLNDIISPADFNEALNALFAGDSDLACDLLMQHYSDHNGGEPRNWQAIADDLCDDLDFISSKRVVV